tara:strand:+ start:458 stop:1054 length:597 start_codon:yes stop_codon:yes gene_type:complete
MTDFINNSNKEPFKRLREFYEKAYLAKQDNIEAIAISSYSEKKNEVDSRFVNLKIVDNEDLIFFSNYLSPKANQFLEHNQISALIFWSKINVQIRFKATIKKLKEDISDEYFIKRSEDKNALAISSDQSRPINSFIDVENKFKKVFKNNDLKKRPVYWGGYSFKPYYLEFWEGNKSRLNKREAYSLEYNDWKKFLLQP